MSEQFEGRFTPEEWNQIRVAPASAGTFVMASSPSGLTGLLAETSSIALTMRELGQASSSAFVRELLHPAQATPAPQQPRETFKTLEEAKDRLLNRVRQAVWLVDAKVNPNDALEYKKLIYAVAERTAQAATEGGFLGIGGTRVSDTERAALEELRTQLRLDEPAAT
jgi:hypothetical protein